MHTVDIACWEEETIEVVREVSPPLGDLALDLSFANPALVGTDLRRHLRVFAVRFHSSLVGFERPYAPLLAHIIERLMGAEYAVCLSIGGEICVVRQSGDRETSEWRVPLANWLVDHELMPRKLWYSMLVLPSSIPFRTGSFFFECPRSLVRPILERYWAAFQSMDLEGYVLPSASVAVLESWNRRLRTSELLGEIMSVALAAFRGFGDNDGILAITSKLDFHEFRERIDLDALVRLGKLDERVNTSK